RRAASSTGSPLIGESPETTVVVVASVVVVLELVVGAAVVDGSLVVVVAPVDAFAAMKIPVPTPTTRTAAASIEMTLWALTHCVNVESMGRQSIAAPLLDH
ncbi:MAG: hypothetical protein ABWZ58_05025, partial [Acidimicrobiia bacterium]